MEKINIEGTDDMILGGGLMENISWDNMVEAIVPGSLLSGLLTGEAEFYVPPTAIPTASQSYYRRRYRCDERLSSWQFCFVVCILYLDFFYHFIRSRAQSRTF